MRTNRPSTEELQIRATSIRKNLIQMVGRNGQGYVQQGLGAADLFTYLYFCEATLDPRDPNWPGRDRIFLSTAHNSAVFHATLSERGIIDPRMLETYTQDGSPVEINVSERLGPMVEATCGSLGQALSVATGVCQSAKRKSEVFRTYVILGDGELQEGQTWEAAMYAGANCLDNLCLIVDVNGLQVEGPTANVLAMAPIDEKWRAFGWAVRSVDGHDFEAMEAAFDWARSNSGQPTVLLFQTLVGRGIPFLEGRMSHNMVFPEEIAEKAVQFLEHGS